MMSPQPQTEADNLEMTNTVQMIKICHPAIEAHHIGHQFGNLTLHSWRVLTAHITCSKPDVTIQGHRTIDYIRMQHFEGSTEDV